MCSKYDITVVFHCAVDFNRIVHSTIACKQFDMIFQRN